MDGVRLFLYGDIEEQGSKRIDLIYQAKSLQTLFSVKWSNWMPHKYINDEVINNVLRVFRRLRVLSLSRYDNIVTLHDYMLLIITCLFAMIIICLFAMAENNPLFRRGVSRGNRRYEPHERCW